MLEFTDKVLGNAEMVAAKGRIDSATSRLLDDHCRALLRAGCKSIVFDFTELQFLNSEGLRTLLGLAKCIRAGGGKLIFTGIRGGIRDMFDIAGFLGVFPVVDRVDADAIA